VIISDSTTIITLLNINRLDVLKNLFAQVNIPQKVYDEIVIDEKIELDSDFFITQQIRDNELCTLLLKSLDAGESEAIVLAKEMELSLIIDEKKGRKIASRLSINIFGFLGLLILNYQKGCIAQEEIIDIYHQAKAEGFRVGKRLEEEFLELMG
jgi:predicted nucleic acid-binding protein